MLIQLKFLVLVLFINLTCILCETQTVKINLKKSNLIPCDKFISYQVDDRSTYYRDIPIENHVFSSAMRLFSPAYFKIPITRRFFSLNNSKSYDNGDIVGDGNSEVDIEKWKMFYNWMGEIGFTPVFQLPYEPATFTPKDVIHLLGQAYRKNMTNCVWQLGIDFKGSSAQRYAEDLKIVRLMLNSFPECSWYLVSADISFGSNSHEIAKFTRLVSNTVSAIGWREPTEISSDEVVDSSDESLKNVIQSDIPVWVSTDMDRSSNDNEKFAQMLAHVGRHGFATFFKKFNPKDYYHPTMGTIIERLYNTVVGSRMFRALPKSGSLKEVQSYVYCSKQYPGSLVVMAVNTDDKTHSIYPYVNSRIGPFEIHQYIVNTKNKKTFINGVESNFTNFEAYIKSKRKSFNVQLHLPGKSVGFWELLFGDIKECFYQTEISSMLIEPLRPTNKTQSTSDLFLQEMIRSTFANEMSPKRTRRAIDKLQFPVWRNRRFILSPENQMEIKNPLNFIKKSELNIFKKLKRDRRDLGRFKRLPKLKLPERLSLKNRLAKAKLEKERKIPIKADKVDSVEQIFQPSDNPYLPKEDVHLEVGKGGNADYDYVEFNDEKKVQNKKTGDIKADFNDAPDVSDNYAHAPNEFHENFGDQFKVPFTNTKSNRMNPQELFEANIKPPNPNFFQVQVAPVPIVRNNDAKLNYVVRELEPTWRQDNENMKRASDTLKSYYINPNDHQQEFVNYDQKYLNPNAFQNDDIHYIRRDQREKSDLPYWRGKRDIASHNQILNAVEEIVESLEKVDKNLVQVENDINNRFVMKKNETTVKSKLNGIKKDVIPKKKAKHNILKPKIRREVEFRSVSSWESNENYNTITNEIDPGLGMASSGMTDTIPIIKYAPYQPPVQQPPENKEYPLTTELLIPLQGSDGNPITRTTATVINANNDAKNNSDSYYDHINNFVKVVTHSLGALMEQSHKQMTGWWHIFS